MITDGLFCDGGLAGPTNPSKIGGTWAWILVTAGEIVRHAAGAFEPEDMEASTVSNNLAELFAAVLALEAMPPGWARTLYTDSRVTLCRLRDSPAEQLPHTLRQRTVALRGGPWKVELVGGHPTRLELQNGYRQRSGLPVSKWNVLVDQRCKQAALVLKDLLIPY